MIHGNPIYQACPEMDKTLTLPSMRKLHAYTHQCTQSTDCDQHILIFIIILKINLGCRFFNFDLKTN